jgi:hypothetical protein
MNFSEREHKTLSFSNEGLDRGAVEETLFPWDMTITNWEKEGLKTDFNRKLKLPPVPTEVGYNYRDKPTEFVDHYYNTIFADTCFNLEKQFEHLDPLVRMAYRIPFLSYEEEIIEQREDSVIKLDIDGCIRRYYKNRDLFTLVKPVVEDEKTWRKHKEHVLEAYRKYCTDEALEKKYGPYREGCARGNFSIRFRLTGFFWIGRDLFGAEPHLYAFYDYPEVLKDINRFLLDIYKEQMEKILKIIKPTVLFFEEDLSGKNGPMLSPDCFDEFIAPCYHEIIPFLKERDVKNVFVDTDGDFTLLIPNFISSGVDGFLPVDVNAGVDLVAVRERFPDVKFIGGFNKLEIVKGPEAIDAEFERLLPVIRQGGYVPGVDHQPAPSTPLKHYQYYLKKLGEIMRKYRGENAE